MTLLMLIVVGVTKFAGAVQQIRHLQRTRSEALQLAANTLEILMSQQAADLASVAQTLTDDHRQRPESTSFDLAIDLQTVDVSGQQGQRIVVYVASSRNADIALAHLEGWVPE